MRDETPVRTLLIDDYDSYTYNLFQQLWAQNGCEPIVVRNDESPMPLSQCSACVSATSVLPLAGGRGADRIM